MQKKAVVPVAAIGGGLAALSVWLYRQNRPKPRSVGVDDYPIKRKPLQVKAGPHTLSGELLLPHSAARVAPWPTVICCHGFGNRDPMCRDTLGKCLAMSGFAVYCFDFYGESQKSGRGRTIPEPSLFAQREDLDGVVDAIAQQPEVDRDNLFLWGEGQGGCVACLTASQHREELKGLVLYDPDFSIPGAARKQGNEKFLEYDVYKAIQGFDPPVLILLGAPAPTGSVPHGQPAMEAFPHATWERIPGNAHGFTGPGKVKAARLTCDFLTNLVHGPYTTTPPAVSPYLPGWEYVADGEPHVFGDRLYIFGSHDQFGGKKFCANDYVGWSAPLEDLTRWQYEGVTYRASQDPENQDGKTALFAPDVAQGPDGRYYLFYCLADFPRIGVAVSNTPAGRYEFLGHVRHPNGMPLGKQEGDVWPFDPAVLVDDDGAVHLYTGQGPRDEKMARKKAKTHGFVCHMELEDDMLTLKTAPQPLLPNVTNSAGTGYEGHEFFEASSIRKFEGRYYFIYSSVQSHELCWAMSDRPDGPFSFGGTLVSNGDIGLEGPMEVGFNGNPDRRIKNYIGNNHGSVEKVNGQYFVFYHRPTNRTMFSRQACVAPIEMTADGLFLQAEMVSSGLGGPLPGLGRYEARIACQLHAQEGCVFSAHPMVQNKHHPAFTQEGADGLGGTQYIENLRNDATAVFKYFDFGEQETTALSVTVRGSGGKLMVRVAENEPPVAEIAVAPSQTWAEFSAPITPLTGTFPLLFTYEGDGTLDFLAFELLRGKLQN